MLRFNHLGDYGTQFGKLIVAWRRWRDEEALNRDAIAELTRIYVRFHEEAESDPGLEDEARAAFRALEEGDPEAMALWQRFRNLSLGDFRRIYERLAVEFDNQNGESFYSPFIPATLEMLRERGLLESSEGADVVRFPDDKMPPALMVKSDGTTIYASRDVAAAIWREDNFHFERNIYVVGLPQKLHFEQVFGILELAGFDWAERCEHVAFGTVRFQTGDGDGEAGGQVTQFSTRAGNILRLDQLLDEAVAKTREIMVRNQAAREDGMTEAEIDRAAELVGRASVQLLYLKSGRERDILFSWEEMLDFEGDTAPYLLYTRARIASILRRAGEATRVLPTPEQLSRLDGAAEAELGRLLLSFDDVAEQAMRQSEPFVITRLLLQLARSYNRFYANTPILATEDVGLRDARLSLCHAVATLIERGLGLLGIETVERM